MFEKLRERHLSNLSRFTIAFTAERMGGNMKVKATPSHRILEDVNPRPSDGLLESSVPKVEIFFI
jgi:hypothetical protein